MFSEMWELRLRDHRYARLLSRVGSLINRRFGAAYRSHIQGSRSPRFNVAMRPTNPYKRLQTFLSFIAMSNQLNARSWII